MNLNFDLSLYETLFLDRDGIINKLTPNYVKCWDEFEFLPNILNDLAKFNKCFKYIFIVTNQRCVGKGLITESQLIEIHKKMLSEIEIAGGRIDKIYYSTGISPEVDPLRKPNIGMALQAKIDFPDINFSKALMIGDMEIDMEFAKKAGMHGILDKSAHNL